MNCTRPSQRVVIYCTIHGGNVSTDRFTADKSAQRTLAVACPGPTLPSLCPGTLTSLTFRWSLPPAWGGAMREAMSFHGHAALAGSSWQFALANPGVSSYIVRDESSSSLVSAFTTGRSCLFKSNRRATDISLFLQPSSGSYYTCKKAYYYVACVTNPDMMSCNYKTLNYRELPVAADVSRKSLRRHAVNLLYESVSSFQIRTAVSVFG